ncbi:MAG: hypothetical protein MUF45_12480, partial [Spirosomaceae bacterium]|nr:hypothetical protein [Spirosomataceae bacterium]
MKRFLYVSFIITSFLRGFSQSSIILPNGNVIPSMTQANRPTNNLTVGQLIYQTDGISGLYLWNGTTWTLVGSGSGNGTVTSVTATTPLSVTNGSTTPQISLSQASSSTNGFLSSTDWTTFNNKQNALANASATTSGILTSTDWTTFNNKQNALANASATTSGILTNTDWTTFNNKQNALANASATTSGILTITDWTTFNNKQNALANASATTSGILTSADWTTFNNKQNALANASATTSGILTNTDWTTFNNKQNALANASATTSGILTSTDWTTFNNKFTLPSLTDGSILFSNGTTIDQNNGGTTIDQNNGSLKWTNSIRRLDVRGLNDGTVGAGFTNWISTTIGGSGGNRIVMGIQNGEATIGAHNEALNAWAKLVLNPAGTTAVGSLVGTGTRMVVANNLGELTTQAIPTATADNLGNHTATQNININNNWISNNGTNAGIKMENTGKVIITNG